MKIKALIDCNGIGYEDFKTGETREINPDIADVLISFGYAEVAEETEKAKPKGGKK